MSVRHANERLLTALEGEVSEEKTVPFLCECADEKCKASVRITLAEYRVVREAPERFIHYPGHTPAPDEEIVEATNRFEIARAGQ